MFESLDQALHAVKVELNRLFKQHQSLLIDVPKLESQKVSLTDQVNGLIKEKDTLQEAIDQGHAIQSMIDDLRVQQEQAAIREQKTLDLAQSVNETSEKNTADRVALEKERLAIRQDLAQAKKAKEDALSTLALAQSSESKAQEIVQQLSFRSQKLSRSEEALKSREKAVLSYSGRLKRQEQELDRRERQLEDREQTLRANLTV